VICDREKSKKSIGGWIKNNFQKDGGRGESSRPSHEKSGL